MVFKSSLKKRLPRKGPCRARQSQTSIFPNAHFHIKGGNFPKGKNSLMVLVPELLLQPVHLLSAIVMSEY